MFLPLLDLLWQHGIQIVRWHRYDFLTDALAILSQPPPDEVTLTDSQFTWSDKNF